MPRSAEEAVWEVVEIVERLPPEARRLWDRGRERVFDIGIQGGMRPESAEHVLGRAALAAIARLGGTLKLTVYAATQLKR
jgi:hypothetical protein